VSIECVADLVQLHAVPEPEDGEALRHVSRGDLGPGAVTPAHRPHELRVGDDGLAALEPQNPVDHLHLQ
jgi:hypothetical protein